MRSDDPWNQTAADNAEWLQRFKRDCGIIKEDGPGLPETDAWAIKLGGSGFAPPYAFPRAQMQPFGTAAATPAVPTATAAVAASSSAIAQQQAAAQGSSTVQVPLREGARYFPAAPDTANKFLETFTQRYEPPATVFCSRELENGLADFVEQRMAHNDFPDDRLLREKACEIVGTDATAADDQILLEKFKEMMRGRLLAPATGAERLDLSSFSVPPAPALDAQLPGLPAQMDVSISDNELNDILQDMQFEFDDGLALQGDRSTF